MRFTQESIPPHTTCPTSTPPIHPLLLQFTDPDPISPSLFPPQVTIPPPASSPHSTPSNLARQYDEILFGDIPLVTTPSTTRIVLNNPSGLARAQSYETIQELLLEWHELGADVFHFSETNMDWRHPHEFQKFRTAARQIFNHVKISTSSSRKRFDSPRQPGGTLTLGTDNFSGRVFEHGGDRVYGRWSYFKAAGRNNRTIVFVTVYQVCDKPVEHSGNLTAIRQQHTILDEEGRLTTTPSGRTHPHPRMALIHDLATQLRIWRDAQCEIILSGDLKESLGVDPNGFGSIASQFHLTDVFRHRHGSVEPATYNRGHLRLDYILCTPALLPAVTACGILPFKVLSLSDHRSLYVDFDTNLLFGSLPSELAPVKSTPFHSRDYANSAKYIEAVHSSCSASGLFARFKDTPSHHDPSLLNSLDDDLGKAMQAGIKAVHRRYKTPFSPILRQTRLLLRYYNLFLQQFKTGHSKSRAIARVSSFMERIPPEPPDQRECHLRLKTVQTSLRTLQTEAVQRRTDFLSTRINLESGGDPTKADQLRARIQKSEELRTVFSKIRRMLNPQQTSHLSRILVPTDTPNPKTAVHWRPVDDPEELVDTLQSRNRRHFGQAAGTPFTTGELSSIPFDASGPVAESVLDGSYTTDDPVLQLLLDEIRRPPNQAIPPIQDLTDAVVSRLASWKEQTSVSPFSQRYLNQYISLIRTIRLPAPEAQGTALSSTDTLPPAPDLRTKARSILNLHVKLLELAITHSHSYPRWQKVANLMLEKDFGLPRIHRLRIIHLYEADFNLLMGLFFARQLVLHTEKSSSFNPGCYGNRAGMSAHEPVLVEELQNTVSCLSRTNRIDLDNDATACYDRIPPNLSNLLARHHGMSQSLCTIHGTTLSNMSYHLLTALGLSSNAYSNTAASPVYGTGQGSTYSPSAWLQIVSKLFDAHGKRAHGATYRSPDRSMQLFLHMLGFVDDTKNHVNDMIYPSPLSAEALVSKMSHDSQLWADLLHSSGAALEFTKMYFYVSIWRFESSGKPFLDPGIQITLPVQSPDRTTTIHVPNKPVKQARRTLGPYKSPGRNQATQIQKLRTQSDEFAKLVQLCYLTNSEAWRTYFTFYLPKMSYILHTSFIPQKDLHSIQQLATKSLLRKSGFNRNTATAVVFGPPSLGGIGFRHLFTEQSIFQACMMYKHLRTPGQSCELYKIAISWAQLSSGTGIPLFEAPDIPFPTLEDPFLVSIRSGLAHLGASLHLTDPFIPSLAREKDFYLMDAIDALGVSPPSDRLKINYCRLFVKAYLASDILLLSGRAIDPAAFHGLRAERASVPFEDYSRQSRPNEASWSTWRRALRLLFLSPRSSDLTITHPLGPWYPLHTKSSLWRAYASVTQLIIRTTTGSLQLFDRSSISRRHVLFPKNTILAIETIPSAFSPIDSPEESLAAWRLPVTSIPSQPPSPPRQFLPAVSILPMFSHLHPSLHSLVESFHPILPPSELRRLLQSPAAITIVGDGGAVPLRASFGGVAAVGTTRIFSVKGQVDGPDPRSYRAEGYAMAASLICMSSLFSFVKPPRPLRAPITLASDNKGLVTKVQEIRTWHSIFLSAALLSEWDILSVILQQLNLLPVSATILHIKGHQDKTITRSALSLLAQLNCEADDLATLALTHIDAPTPTVPVFPSAQCQLDVAESTVTRQHFTSLRLSATTPALEKYICDRNSWSRAQYSSVSWEAFNAARHVARSPRFIPKFCHRHLPVGAHVSRNSPNYSPACPSCPSLHETDTHFLRCSGPSRLQWRNGFSQALRVELTRLHTDQALSTFTISALRASLLALPVLPSPEFQSLSIAQESIGWLLLFRGYWSSQWLQQHQRTLHARPHPNPAVQSTRIRDQDEWLKTLARFVMHQIQVLWIVRNQDQHGTTPAERAHRLRISVELELSALYALRSQCSARHQQLFYSSLEEHKTQPLSTIRQWIQLNRDLIQKSSPVLDSLVNRAAGT